MVTTRGKADVRRFIVAIPPQLETKVLRGAARAAADVVAEEARLRSLSQEVSDAIKVATSAKGGRIIAKVQVKGPGAYLAPWLEHGTAPHIIRASDAAKQGMSIGRINRLDKAAAKDGRTGPGHALVINGRFVGDIIHHPGARPHPFLRPALDTKEAQAIAAAQSYIAARVSPAGITGSPVEDDVT